MTRAGKSAREIATELNIQPATVAEQRRRARVAGELQ
ncbi:MAG: hypothetical protein IE923_04365 [Micrococcales bacterium]|nr:hypothetical protein [Micrococcales bacterium]